MIPAHSVPCPRCGRALFSATSLDDGVNAAAPQTPRLLRDGQGEYMRCPHCAARVAMTRVARGEAEEVQVAPGATRGA